ncbi:MAG: phage head-tail connector protein [Bacillota bacterium]|nr:phage head-tail connector protein [Bacillota bacterium]
MASEKEQELLQEVKNHLRITWDDEDDEISSIIARGKSRLTGLAGPDLLFKRESLERDLLLNYCRYAYNNALEYFEDSFHREIVRLQLQEAVKDYAEQKRPQEDS